MKDRLPGATAARRELTVNVQALPELCRDDNGGEYVLLRVPRSRYFVPPTLLREAGLDRRTTR